MNENRVEHDRGKSIEEEFKHNNSLRPREQGDSNQAVAEIVLQEEDRRAQDLFNMSGMIEDLVDLRLQSHMKTSEKVELNTRVTRVQSSDMAEVLKKNASRVLLPKRFNSSDNNRNL